jgi:dienelactone hydrolase
MRRAVVALAVLVALSGCSGGGDPAPVPSASQSAVSQEKQATIDGEWVLTRTVTASDDVNNPAHEVGAVSTRYVKFGDVVCPVGACTGGVLSGPTQTVRDSSTFSSSADTITYDFSGFLNCLRQDTGAVLVVNGYSYSAHVVLTLVTTDPVETTKAVALEGTLTYTDTVTNEALEAGCSRDPVTTTTEYALTAVRGALAPVAVNTSAPTP